MLSSSLDELRADNNAGHIKMKADIELNASKLALTNSAVETLRADNNVEHAKL